MEALGIDIRSLIFQLVNFVVLFAILTKLLHKPLMKLLDSRSKEIEEGLENAERARKQLEEAEAKQQEILDAAEKKGRKIIEDVKEQAKELESQLHAEAQAKAEQLLARTQEEMVFEREKLRGELKGELASLVVEATSKVLESPITAKEKREQIGKLVAEIKK